MIKHNETAAAASINVLAEGELDQVVGGCGRGQRRGYGWGSRHDYGKGYDKGGYDKSTDKGSYDDSSYEPSYGSGSGGSGDNVVVNNNQNITLDINIQQVAG